MAFQLDLGKNQSLYIPLAIIVGFLVLAAAIYGSGRRGVASQQQTQQPSETPAVAGDETSQGEGEARPEPESLGETDLNAFAQCLANKGATLYAHKDCSHCKDQKDLFGASFQHLDHVECADESSGGWSQTCIKVLGELGERVGVPTWIFRDGSYLQGKQSLKTLAEKTDCPLQ